MKKRSDKVILSPKQTAEIERRFRDDDCSNEKETRQVFARLTNGPRALKPARRLRP
jgi:hypothetical protein